MPSSDTLGPKLLIYLITSEWALERGVAVNRLTGRPWRVIFRENPRAISGCDNFLVRRTYGNLLVNGPWQTLFIQQPHLALVFRWTYAYFSRNDHENLPLGTHGSSNQRVESSHPNFCDRRSARGRTTDCENLHVDIRVQPSLFGTISNSRHQMSTQQHRCYLHLSLSLAYIMTQHPWARTSTLSRFRDHTQTFHTR